MKINKLSSFFLFFLFSYSISQNQKLIPLPTNSCNIILKIDQSSFSSCLSFSFFYSIELDPSQTIQGMIWDFGDGQVSNEEYPFHMYSTYGIYFTSLTVVVTNSQDNTCCVVKAESTIKVDNCSLCELIQINQIQVEDHGGYRLFKPSIPHSPKLLYKWEIYENDNEYPSQVYKIRSLMSTIQNSIGLSIKLNILYSDPDTETCCKASSRMELYKIER